MKYLVEYTRPDGSKFIDGFRRAQKAKESAKAFSDAGYPATYLGSELKVGKETRAKCLTKELIARVKG